MQRIDGETIFLKIALFISGAPFFSQTANVKRYQKILKTFRENSPLSLLIFFCKRRIHYIKPMRQKKSEGAFFFRRTLCRDFVLFCPTRKGRRVRDFTLRCSKRPEIQSYGKGDMKATGRVILVRNSNACTSINESFFYGIIHKFCIAFHSHFFQGSYAIRANGFYTER